jgi:ribosomal protein S18 acetylase RimI-like enzyme
VTADALLPAGLSIRKGILADADRISRFNQAMALETEGRALIAERVDAGVRQLLAQPSLGFYVVATDGSRIVACLLVTQEWSDWRNGLFWWIQSVFVEAPWRRKGVYSALYRFVREQADADPGVCGFRLYVEHENVTAQQTYEALGMERTGYLVYEQMKPGVRYLAG